MVALVFSFVTTLLCVAIVLVYARRRAVGTYLTWGEAMVASVFVFGALFLLYGILPHQWLVYADNELAWRRDKILFGPGDVFAKVLPFTVTYEAIRDFIAVGIYVVGLGGQIALWSIWQNRGKTKPKALPTSAFGRPLARPAASEPARSGGA